MIESQKRNNLPPDPCLDARVSMLRDIAITQNCRRVPTSCIRPETSRHEVSLDQDLVGTSCDAMGRDSRSWNELREEGVCEAEKRATRSIGGSDYGLGDSEGVRKFGADDKLSIEMGTIPTRATDPAFKSGRPFRPPSADTECSRSATQGERGTVGVEYKVYKRRWFGLLQLTLLNIIVSWDVSSTFFDVLQLSRPSLSSPVKRECEN